MVVDFTVRLVAVNFCLQQERIKIGQCLSKLCSNEKGSSFCRAMRCISVAYVVMRCLAVCLSVTFVNCAKTNEDIFESFSPSGSHTILVFPHQTAWQYPDGNPCNGGVECRWGRQKTRFWTNIWLRCIHVYSVANRTSRELWKIKPRRTAASVEHTAASVVRCSHDMTTKCLWQARRYTPERRSTPRTQPRWS